MKEYSLHIHTNIWNAVRFFVITLVLVPVAEKLWALAHSKRTGARLMRGHTARLRKSMLAHWGLHQEVDESSRMSRAAAIAVCLLHIAGALLLEYGSGATEYYFLQKLSTTTTFIGGMGADEMHFVDVGYLYGKKHGSKVCIDGEPRQATDFGIRWRVKPVFTFVPSDTIPRPNSEDLQVAFYSPNTDRTFRMYDNGRARWYDINATKGLKPSLQLIGFINDTISCHFFNASTFECSKSANETAHLYLLSKVIARVAVEGAAWIDDFWKPKPDFLDITVNLDNVSIRTHRETGMEKARETAWVRDGMPREGKPSLSYSTFHIDVKGLKTGCNHEHAVLIKYLQLILKPRYSNVSLPGGTEPWTFDGEGDKLLVLISGDRTWLGTVTQISNGYCASYDGNRLCVKRLTGKIYELALSDHHSFTNSRNKRFSIAFRGALENEDALNLAVQALVEVVTHYAFITPDTRDVESRAVEFIESGIIYMNLIRVVGKAAWGRSGPDHYDIATVNVLGIVGLLILLVLVTAPIPMLIYYRRSTQSTVEELYRRLLIRTDVAQNRNTNSDETPTVTAKEIFYMQ